MLAVAPSNDFLPSRSTKIRSATRITCCMLWLTKITATPWLLQPLDERQHDFRLLHAERGGGFVEQHDLAAPHHRARDRDRLPLPAGQRADLGLPAAAGQPQSAESRGDLAAAWRHLSSHRVQPSSGQRRLAVRGRDRRSRQYPVSARRRSAWNTVSMPALRASCADPSVCSTPSMRICPDRAWIAPETMLVSVLLPAPLSPIRPTISAGYSETHQDSARTAPKACRSRMQFRIGVASLTAPVLDRARNGADRLHVGLLADRMRSKAAGTGRRDRPRTPARRPPRMLRNTG